MITFYQLSAWYAILEVYQMPNPIPSLYSLGVAPFSSGFLLNLPDTIGPRAKHIFFHCISLHDQPRSTTLFPSRSWTLLFFKCQSMLLWWYASWAWIDQRLVWDCLYSRYWLLHSRQSCLVGNFKPSFQQCLKKGQLQCNSVCFLSYLSSSSWCWYAWSFNQRW